MGSIVNRLRGEAITPFGAIKGGIGAIKSLTEKPKPGKPGAIGRFFSEGQPRSLQNILNVPQKERKKSLLG